MDTNRLVLVVATLVVAGVLAVVIVPDRLDRGRADARPSTLGDQPWARTDSRQAPALDGEVLPAVGAADQPPEPTQWAAGGPIPSNTWWSSAVTGPGAISLWPQPLALSISPEGRIDVASPSRTVRPDGSSEAPLVPALSLDLGRPARTTVIDHGPLHVTLRVATGSARVDLTLVQGSPLVELDASGPLTLRAPGLELTGPSAKGVEVLTFRTGRGPWVLGAARPAAIGLDGEELTITPGDDGHLVLGPVPAGSGAPFEAGVRTAARHPLLGSAEHIEVAPEGTTTQVLTVSRADPDEDPVPSLWALQPHHQAFAVDTGPPLGLVPSALGDLPVVAGTALRLDYPAVPVLWSAVPLPGASAPAEGVVPEVEAGGSYFGGKAAYSAAALGDALRAGGSDEAAEEATAVAARLLDTLRDPEVPPSVRWDDRWGSAVITPAEFGAGAELNDHQLQYGYWVAAASHLADVDPDVARRFRALVDLLIADYAGAETVPDAPSSLPARRTWSPYEGHSWASGTARFADGNNLESISESSFAWWAAARWFLSTGRAEEAAVFIGRFTIESALTGFRWLPQGDRLPGDASQRPWSGVVWSAKDDPGTWFDPEDESALGIRLLPLGPASLARYPSDEARAAARARWDWCADFGDGCTTRWANLLDSDAAVAGRPRLTGPTPEPSVTTVVATWWRDLWEATAPAEGWSCSIGAVPRQRADGSVVVLAAHPGPAEVLMTCRDSSGAIRWSAAVDGPAAVEVEPAP